MQHQSTNQYMAYKKTETSAATVALASEHRISTPDIGQVYCLGYDLAMAPRSSLSPQPELVPFVPLTLLIPRPPAAHGL